MEGHLEKWTNYFSGWQKRYCVIKGEIFYYFHNKGDPARGKVHLSLGKIEDVDKQGTKFDLDTGCNIYHLRTKSVEEKKKWINAFKIAKLEAEKSHKQQDKSKIEDNKMIVKESLNENTPLHLRLSRLRKYASNIEYNGVNIYKHITSSYDLGQDETSITLLSLLSNNKNETRLFNRELLEVLSKLHDFSSNVKYLNSFLNEENEGLEDAMKLDEKEGMIMEGIYKTSIPGVNSNAVADKILFFDAQEENDTPTNQTNNQSNQNNKIQQVVPINKSKNKYNDTAYSTYKKRNRLEKERIEMNINLWSVLKDAIGKDLNKFSVPVYFNEPISMLQRLCENFQYADLLNKATREKDPYIQLAYLAAFNISGHSLNPNRVLKSFNPLLGETYELIDTEIGFKYFAEQVCHHPAISACYIEGEDYNFYTNSNTKQNFYITKGTFEITNLGRSFFNIISTGASFSYNRPKVVARNIIMGKTHIDFTDTFTVTNHNTGDICEVTLYPIGEPTKTDQGYFKGVVKTYLDEDKLTIEGSWLSHFDIIYNGERRRLWEKVNTDTKENYYFTDFSSNLNNITDELKKELPPTDSRLRPDQRAMENRDLDLAAKEKLRLEEKQRQKRKETEKKNKNHKHIPMYFTETYDDLTGELIYKYSNKYWEDRAKKNFGHFPDIY